MSELVYRQETSALESEVLECQNKELRGLLYPALDNELSVQQLSEWKEHLSTCRACQEHFGVEKALKTALQAKVKGVPAPEELHKTINQLIDKA